MNMIILMSKEIFKQILITLLLVAISTTLYSQTAYYWSGGRQINMTINNNKYFIVSNKADSTAVKNELQNVLTISPFKPFQIGAVQNNATNTMNSKCWAIVETSSPINIPSNSSIDYITPHFTLSDSTTVGISNLFYVKLRNLSDTLKLDSLSNLYNVTRLGYYSRMPLWWTMGCTKYSTGNSLEMANLFYETGLFTFAQPDIMCDIVYDCTNDNLFSSQWGLNNQDYSGYDIDYCKVRNITIGSSNVIVAVYDSGIQMDHPDLNNISSVCYNIEDSTNTNVITYPHGTRCAGVIGATSNNNIGIAGICPSSPIISICKGNTGVSVDDGRRIANGFYFALENNASVVNCSWHVAENDFVRNAIDSIVNCGIVVVASASNRGVDSVAFPASMTNVIGVGAIYKDGSRHRYSNYGDSLNVVAPGSNIFTTDINGGYYDFFEKTSAATPHVSAIAALMLSVNPNLTNAQVKTIIEKTAQRIRTDLYTYTDNPSVHPNGTWNNQMGYGLVDAHRAVMEAYFYNHYIDGDGEISACDILYYELSSTAKPDNTTVQWSVTNNLEIVSSDNAGAYIKAIGTGTGTITVGFTHEGCTVSKEIQVTITGMPTMSYYYNYSSNGNATVSGAYINGTFTVNSTDVVTLTGGLLCFPDAKFVVQPGGKLIIDDAKIANYCQNKMWDGIYVVGNKNQRQLAQYQGTLEVKNNSIIENAKCAIVTWDGSDYNTSGGIVKCTSSTFKNNSKNAEFLAYTNHNASNNESNNVSYFKNCNFTIDNSNLFSSSNATYTDMIKMWGVNGILIRGCHFSDNRTGSPTLGNAISVASAGVTIKPSCNSMGDYSINMPCICVGESRNTFSGFTKALNAQNTGTNYPFKVFKADFENCSRPVHSSAVNNFNVTMSDINLTCAGGTVNKYGIYSLSCT
ncbi:MAG: S8 family serine peptidase, partial [Bacteroidales bacterium]|nr:S8 family serine peptidase [Bacteroidales bacterium]